MSNWNESFATISNSPRKPRPLSRRQGRGATVSTHRKSQPSAMSPILSRRRTPPSIKRRTFSGNYVI